MGGRSMMWWRRNAGAEARTQTAGRRTSRCRENTFFAKQIRVQRALNPRRTRWWRRRNAGAEAQTQTAGRRTSHCRENTLFCETNSVLNARGNYKDDDVAVERKNKRGGGPRADSRQGPARPLQLHRPLDCLDRRLDLQQLALYREGGLGV